MEFQLGLIGAGAVARGMYLPVVQRLAGDSVRLVAVADCDFERAEAVARLTGAKAYADYQLLLEQPGLDGVIVATPIGTHAAIALDALRAGKHVLLQKPMATTLVEADALIAMAQQSGAVLQCEPGHRLHPFASQAGKDLADGRIGDLCVIVARSAHSGPPNQPWFYFQEHGGSVIFDMGVHALTWVLGVAGPARAVTAVYARSIGKRLINGQTVQPDIVDNALITLELTNGALATIITNYCTLASLSPSYELYGSRGTILVNTPQGGYLRYPAGEGGNGSVPAKEQPGWFVPTHTAGLQAQPLPNMVGGASSDVRLTSLGHFVECIRTGATPVPSAGFARHTLDVMLKAADAAASGQRQTLTSAA